MNENLLIKTTNRFNTLIISFVFPFTLVDEDIAKSAILPSLLIMTNNKCQEESLFRRKLIENLIIDIYCGLGRIGKQRTLNFTLIIPDQETIKQDILKKSLQFFIDTIYDPWIEDNSFNEKYFNRKKVELQTIINNSFTNVNFYNIFRIFQIINPDGELNKNIENYPEQLDTLNPIDTYQFYKNNVSDKLPYVFAIGNLDKNQLKSIMDELLYIPKSKNKYEKIDHDFTYYLTKDDKNINKIEEIKPFSQSCLNYVYKVKNMKPEDVPYLRFVDLILSSSSSDLLMKNLRKNGKLVYYAQSDAYILNGLLIIDARIGRKSKAKAMEIIEMTMESLKDPKIIEPLIANVKERKRINLIRNKDSQNVFLNELIYVEYLKCDLS